MEIARRRIVSVPGVAAAVLILTFALPLWLPLLAAVDLVRGRRRLPLVRLLAFAMGWAWLETVSVVVTFGLWLARRGTDLDVHYRLQRWWADRLVRLLERTTGIRVRPEGVEALTPGPVVVLCRHASLADSLVSAWVLTTVAGLRPRYVLKRELLADPCLDIVGNRLPNHFLHREAPDGAVELAALERLAVGLGDADAAVIFPEGTRASVGKRRRALERIAERDPDRAALLAGLRHLLPPRPAGTLALLAGAPTADVAIAWHTGFDGLDTFGGILRALARPPVAVRFVSRRIPRHEVPSEPGALAAWLDAVWCEADAEVAVALAAPDDVAVHQPDRRNA